MNKCLFLGRLSADVELKTSQSGTTIGNFTIAVQSKYKNQDGNYDTNWIRCTAFGKTAEFIAQYFRKGYMINIIGNLRTRSYQTADGETKYTWSIIVEEANFTGERHDNDNNGYNNYAPANTENNYYPQQTQQNYSQAQQNYNQPPIPDYETTDDYDSLQDDDLPF